jgi:CrcB protein
MLRNFLFIGAGGAMGSMARYGVSYLMSKFIEQPLRFYSTFTINVLGSFIIGLLFGLVSRHQISPLNYLILATGFCGGFTTFSTFTLENIDLMSRGQSLLALFYTGLSMVVGLLLCRVGIWLAG